MLIDVIGHEDIKTKLKKISSNPPKVLLFTGPSGVGKKHTALNFINEIHNGYLKGKLFSHPDIYIFTPDTKTFKLELVDKMRLNASTTPFELSRKYFILNDVDLMNKESGNACLKILEECPDYIHFILLASDSENVLDTIRSRCMEFSFQPIPNLKQFFPNLTDLQIKVMRGCVGNKDFATSTELKPLYEDIRGFIDSFSKMTYADIIEWGVKKETLDISHLVDLFMISLEESFLNDSKTFTVDTLLREFKDFRNNINLNINSKMHFRNSLLQAKYNLEKLN